MTPDPIGLDGGINLYAYTSNNPLNAIDPFGLSECQDRTLEWIEDGAKERLNLYAYEYFLKDLEAYYGSAVPNMTDAQLDALYNKIAKEYDGQTAGLMLFIFARGYVAPKNVSKIVKTTPKQLQKKFNHASDFGVAGNYSKANAKKFNSAINQHLNAPGTKAIQGTYRGDPVTHHLNPKTGLNVITDASGNFVSGWRLGPAQLQNVLRHGGLN